MLRKWIGTKKFYKEVIKVTLPIMIQQVLINIVGLADNLMVGQLSEDIISGVYIATKIAFIAHLAIFGACAGSSIFFSQYVGIDDTEHVKQCFRFKMYVEMVISTIAFLILFLFGKPLALLFVNETQAIEAANYLKVYSISLLFMGFGFALATSFREIHKARIPMISSIIGLVVNISLNYVFIFLLDMGVIGAAIATLIARISELGFSLVYCFITKPSFFTYPGKIEARLNKEIFVKTIPLLLNEILWSTGQTMLVFAYTKVSDIASPAMSISQVLFDFFYLANIALGNGIAVIMGNVLGKNDTQEAKKEVFYFISLTIVISIIVGLGLYFSAPLVASFYKVSEQAKLLALKIATFNAILMIIFGLNNAIFFMIRSGGLAAIVIVFDSAFIWVIQVPAALILSLYTNIELQYVFLIVNGLELIKLIFGIIIIFSNIWIKNLTHKDELNTAN